MTAVTVGALRDGTPVIVSGGRDSLRVWWLADGTPVGESLTGDVGGVKAVAVGTLRHGTPVIVSVGNDGTMRVWRLADGTPVGEPLSGLVTAVAVGALRHGTPVIVSNGYGGVRVWRPTRRPFSLGFRVVGRPVGEPLTGHIGEVKAVAVGALRDGTPVIVSGGRDSLRVWRLARRPLGLGFRVVGRPVGEPLTGHTGEVKAVAVGTLRHGTPVIVSGGRDGTVRVWRLADGTPLGHPLDLSEPVKGIALHGNIIVTAAGRDIAVHQPIAQ